MVFALRRYRRRVVACVALTLGGCRGAADAREQRVPTRDSASTNVSPVSGTLRYEGAGFTLDLPPGSAIRRGSGEDTLRGPLVSEPERSAELGGTGPHPAFALVATSALNATRPVGAWVDSVRRARNARAGEIAQVLPADPDSLGAEPALRLEVYCGDCEAAELYAGRGNRIIRLAFEQGIHLAGTRLQQAAANRAVLRTFKWTQ